MKYRYVANCGKGEEETGKLKACTACKMVKYCNRECQIAHRPQHTKECKKRAAELYDEKLFKQPPTEDCPICFVRLPLLDNGWKYMTCCGKVICSGCARAPVYDDQGNKVDNQKCAFCRTPHPTEDESFAREMKREDLDDPIAIFNHGMRYFIGTDRFPQDDVKINSVGDYYRRGTDGVTQDYNKALELFHRSGKLGHSMAYCNIGIAYYKGIGVEVDKEKAKHYWELAAMSGNALARRNLGNNELLVHNMEKKAGNFDRALKHYTIAARDGDSESLNMIKEMYSKDDATKEDYMKALRSYQEYLNEIKNSQRDEAAAHSDYYQYY